MIKRSRSIVAIGQTIVSDATIDLILFCPEGPYLLEASDEAIFGAALE